ncbi:MAG: protein BatD [Alistipes sp.]|nr:protein BatD [Alistipes sp.]
MKRIFILRLTLLLVALFTSVQLWAQVTFKAEAPLLVATNERVYVKFSVNKEPDGDNTFKSPSFEGFTVIAGPAVSTGMEMQWINGHQTTNYSRTYTFVLLPQDAGKFTIDAASIEVDGKKYQTKPLLIEVIDESAAPAPNAAATKQQSTQQPAQQPSQQQKDKSPEKGVGRDDIFIVLNVSDKEVYKGEALRATLMLYTRVDYPEIQSFNMPTFNDFWTQEVTSRTSPSRAEYNGRIYDTYKLTEHIIAPQRTGNITISPAELNVAIRIITQTNTGSMFHSGHHVSYVNRVLRSQPVTIKVKEFPANAPASFSGVVGSFTMSSKAPEATMSANSSNELSVTISGSGNLKFIAAPKLTLPESFEIYDTKVIDNIRTSASGSSGSITYTYPFVARAAGEYHIEPLVFSYFDLESKQYKSLSTEPFVITVTDDGSVVAKSADSSRGYADYGGRMKQLDRDIRFIHTDKLAASAHSLFVLSPMYWLTIVVIVALFIVVYHLMRKRIRQNRNVVARRMRQADKVAVQRLRLAERSMLEGNRHAFYEEMLRAMWGYVSDKFNIPVSNLTKETIREELYRRGVSAADAEQFCQIISRSDEAQYAPSTESDMGEVYADAVSVISKIESIVKR